MVNVWINMRKEGIQGTNDDVQAKTWLANLALTENEALGKRDKMKKSFLSQIALFYIISSEWLKKTKAKW